MRNTIFETMSFIENNYNKKIKLKKYTLSHVNECVSKIFKQSYYLTVAIYNIILIIIRYYSTFITFVHST